MSFKLFIYYCAVAGAWAAFVGWALGRRMTVDGDFLRAAVQGMTLGILVAFALGVLDGLWNQSLAAAGFVLKVCAAVAGGGVGALASAAASQAVAGSLPPGPARDVLFPPMVIGGWALTGLSIGASVGLYDLSAGGAVRKIRNGLLGGAVGGLVGGGLKLVLELILVPILGRDKDLLSPAAFGFVALGAAIGLATGLAQVMLRDAWLRVEAGTRAGLEVILTKPETVIGRAERCDVGLPADAKVARTHAKIQRHGQAYLLSDADTPDGTFLNDERVAQPTRLQDGDMIKVGSTLLRFGERQKNVSGKEPRR